MTTTLPQPIGILGGTFDPIHLGHLHIALQALQQLNLQEVRLIPCYQPVHRKPPIANAADRLEMTKLAVAPHPGLVVDDREIHRQGPSYMFDTLTSLRQELGDTPLCLIVATDVFADFTHWHRWQEIPELAHIIVANRKDYPLPEKKELLALLKQRQITNADELAKNPSGSILIIDFPEFPISATQIRQLFATGQDPKDLLPAGVWQYIQAHRLYR